jgi:hypothetical protein
VGSISTTSSDLAHRMDGESGRKGVYSGMMAMYHLWLVRNDGWDEALIEDPSWMGRRILALLEDSNWHQILTAASANNPWKVDHWRPPPLD